MRIAILTHPLRYNYGCILQNFALQTVLVRMGHTPTTLDPIRYKYKWWLHIPIIIRHFIGRYIRGHKHTKVFEDLNADWRTYVMGKNTFHFIDRYIQRKAIKNLAEDIKPNDYDAFIVGSDQVWRPECFSCISNMFLDFTQDWNVKRIAYAASFGINTWKASKETTNFCRKLIKMFDFISVREDSGVSICEKFFDVHATHVLDPAMLLTKEDYISILKLDKVLKSKGNLLVYILDYTEEKNRLIQKISENYNLIPFRVNSDVEDYETKDVSKKIQPPVEQWLRGFYDAEYVISDSFHACVFSIIFNKPFVSYVNEFRGSARYESLWNKLCLSKGLITKASDFDGFCYLSPESVSRLLTSRKEALDILTEILSVS